MSIGLSLAEDLVEDSAHYEKRLTDLIRHLTANPEDTWLEFKRGNADPEQIGKNLSALSNAAALHDKPSAYMLWGIDDGSRSIVGTDFDHRTARGKGAEPLESWLMHLVEPNIHLFFHRAEVDGKQVVVLEIPAASLYPVAFKGTRYIRIGSVTKSLQSHPDLENDLWHKLRLTPYEARNAGENLSDEEVLAKLDCQAYFSLLGKPLPPSGEGILEYLKNDKLIKDNLAGNWDITNPGALLLANDLSDFPALQRKTVRIIRYEGDSRAGTATVEFENLRGYACSFENMLSHIKSAMPSHEVLEDNVFRETVYAYPMVAIRELLANALIHQDLDKTGAAVMVEIFDERMEISNPGEPLIDLNRIVDTSPQSRNENIASLMRRFAICEERGSGIDKVLNEVENQQLPAPFFEKPPNATRVTLYARRPLQKMNRKERVRACYLHACLHHVKGQEVTNASVRERFAIAKNQREKASRIIKEAMDDGLVAIADPNVGFKSRTYLPYWAAR